MDSLVSIITPVYNSEAFISDTIHSILNQTYTHWELIIVDDGSVDKTIDIVKNFQKQNSKIKLIINERNQGAAISRNKGISMAQGNFIAFLDADDLWVTHKLERQIHFMKTKNCAVSFSSYELIDESGTRLNKCVKSLPFLSFNKLLKSNYIGNLTGVYNAKLIGKITSPHLRKRQDWLLWLTAIKVSGKPAQGIKESLAYYRIRKNSISANKLNLLKHNYWVYRKGLGYSTLKSIQYMLIFLIEHFFVKSKQIVPTIKI